MLATVKEIGSGAVWQFRGATLGSPALGCPSRTMQKEEAVQFLRMHETGIDEVTRDGKRFTWDVNRRTT